MTAPATTGTGAEPDPEVPAVPQPEPDLAAAPDEDENEDEYRYEDETPERRMSPLAIITMIVAILVIAAGVGAVATHSFLRKKTKLTYQVPAVFKLRAGDCFNSGQNGINLTLRSCSTPHDAEVFATFPVIASSWPGDTALRTEAQSGCAARVAGYMNPALAANSFDQEYLYPDKVAWQAGVRTVICDVRSSAGPITGSVRQGS
jgi:Septum formation